MVFVRCYRGRDTGRDRGEGRERDISGGRRYSRERAIFAPRDRRGLISPRQKCLPRREGRDGRDRRPADDVSRHRFRQSGDRKNYSDGGRGRGKDDDYYFPRGSNARRGERREASPKNASSKTNATEPSEKDGVPKAAVGKRTTPTGRNLGSSSGDSGDTARHCPRYQPTAVGGDAFKLTPVGRVCFRDDVKVSHSTGGKENFKADLKRRRPSHTGDVDAGGVSRLRMESGFVSHRYSAATKVRVDVASSSSSRASSAAAAAAAAAASKAAGTVHARPLSGIGVLAERLRVGGGSFADVFTDPAALRLGASSNGWAESSRSSQHDVRPDGGGTCVGKKRERTVLGYSGPRRENPPDGGQSRASSDDMNALLEERKKRCRRSS